MFEYKFVAVEGGFGSVSIAIFATAPVTKFDDHRAIIQQQAEEGWRLVTVIPTRVSADGIGEIDLVFERELK